MSKNDFKIDKGIEVPPPRAKMLYPLKQMEVGDSFFVETDNRPTGIYSSAAVAGIKVRCRNCEKDGKKGYRIWRVE